MKKQGLGGLLEVMVFRDLMAGSCIVILWEFPFSGGHHMSEEVIM